MRHELIIAGFGGQGVLLMGQILAEAALLSDLEVVWTPAYGPEMRGGPAFCTVIIADHPIDSPVIAQPESAIIMDMPSMARYQSVIMAKGNLFMNSSLIDPGLVLRDDLHVYPIPANHLAEKVGDVRTANMVMLGGFLQVTPLITPAIVLQALEHALTSRRSHLIPMNANALQLGAEAIMSSSTM